MAEEQKKNVNLKAVETPSEEDASADKRERSTIDFPYNDLDNAIEIARAISDNAGSECSPDQLAGYLKVTLSGPIRVRFSNAGVFGLTDSERGKIRLTELGRRIVDPKFEASARAEAFLKVPLFGAIFEKYKGFSLPSAKGLEREMQALGVSSKQTNKARQAFTRSARQAGFFAHGEDRLVRPAVSAERPITPPLEKSAEENPRPKGGNGGGDGPDLSQLHPFIQGLVMKLPTPETEWSLADRVKWLQTAANIFDLIYKGEGGVTVNAAIATRSPRPHE